MKVKTAGTAIVHCFTNMDLFVTLADRGITFPPILVTKVAKIGGKVIST